MPRASLAQELPPATQATISILVSLDPQGPNARLLLEKSKDLLSFTEAEKNLSIRAQATGITLRWNREAKIKDLIEAMNDPSNLGVIWISEGRIHYVNATVKNGDLDVYNAALEDRDGYYVPKDLKRAAHPGLQFLALNSCFFTAIEKFYQLGTPLPFDLLHPFRLSYEELKQQKISKQTAEIRVGLKNIFEKIESQLDQYLKNYQQKASATLLRRGLPDDQPENSSESKITIAFADLKSNRFTYVVEVNQRLVGVLQPVITHKDQAVEHMADHGNQIFTLPGGLVTTLGRNQIRIYPDDAHRKMKDPQSQTIRQTAYQVDDILIDQVELLHLHQDKRQILPLITESLHLGDEDHSDSISKLTFKRHAQRLQSIPVQAEWMVHF